MEECCKQCGQPLPQEEKADKEVKPDALKMKSGLLDELMSALEGDEIGQKIQVIIAKKKKPEEE